MKSIWLVLLLLVAGCVKAWSREPSGVYPDSELNGKPTYFIGWQQKFYLDPAHHWRPTFTDK